MELFTERLHLRPFTPEDGEALWQIFKDEETMRALCPYTKEETLEFLRSFCVERTPPGGWAVEEQATGGLIGYVLFHSPEDPVCGSARTYEIGWVFRRDKWRQGFATEICREVLRFGFEELHLHRIFAETTDALRSVGLMEKLGMHREGVLRQAVQATDGAWQDLYLYALLESDFFSSREANQ